MNLIGLTPEQRIRDWRNLRQSLVAEQSDYEHLHATAIYWARCPLVSYYVDWDNPSSWPTPWELIYRGEICPSGVAICIAHTLLNAGDGRWGPERVKVSLIEDHQFELIYLIVIIDQTHVLNFDKGCVASLEQTIRYAKIIQTYSYLDGAYVN